LVLEKVEMKRRQEKMRLEKWRILEEWRWRMILVMMLIRNRREQERILVKRLERWTVLERRKRWWRVKRLGRKLLQC
jgi:hypothetical protein